MSLKILYVMDPMERIQVDADSTFVIQVEAQSRGHHQYHAHPRDLAVVDGVPRAKASRVTVAPTQGEHFELEAPEWLSLTDFDAVLMRKDPPFNMHYVYATYILELVQDDVFVLNRPDSLRGCNEKLYSLQFPEWIPKTVVAAHADAIQAFCEQVGGMAVIKPLDGAGGEGIFLLQAGDPNWNAIVEQATAHGTTPVVVQEYLPAIVEDGDKRIILLNGEPLGSIRRIPPQGELRGNIHVGGRCEVSVLTPREEEMCEALGPAFRDAGLWFVGIDVIGDYLTEINVTSPTGIQEINALDGVQLEKQVIDFIEAQCKNC